MSGQEHRPEVVWDGWYGFRAVCLYPFTCGWASRHVQTEIEAIELAEEHRLQASGSL